MRVKNQKPLQKELDDNLSCYVLITCEEATPDGQMQVKMTHKGDSLLASYLLQGAQKLMEREEEYSSISSIKLIK
jgi:hypothetical protein